MIRKSFRFNQSWTVDETDNYHDPWTKSFEHKTGSHLNAPRRFLMTSFLVIAVPSGRRITIELAPIPWVSVIFQIKPAASAQEAMPLTIPMSNYETDNVWEQIITLAAADELG
jgi:hypothetical protein